MSAPLHEGLKRWIAPDPSGGCWLWTGRLNNKGYARAQVPKAVHDVVGGRRVVLVHRALYEERFGVVPPGLELDHLCRTPRCVNPDHLEPVTHAENMARSARSRDACRQGHPYAEHGYIRSNGNRRCRECDRLAAARRAASRPPRPRKPRSEWNRPMAQHGSQTMYRYHGCRCEPCRETERIRSRESRVRRLAGEAS